MLGEYDFGGWGKTWIKKGNLISLGTVNVLSFKLKDGLFYY